MRLVLAAAAMFLIPPLAHAADWSHGWSGVKGEPSYEAARRELVNQGFSPVPILAMPELRRGECPGGMCRTFPEVMDCSQGLQHCAYLYRQRKTGRYWIGFSVGGGSPPHYRRVRYTGLFRADQSDLDDLKDLVIRGSDGRPFRYRSAERKAPH
jgi:hypothetical protein